MNAVDTKILIYAHDQRDADKQARATPRLDALDEGLLLWQVACEFLAATRKLIPLGYDQAVAWEEIRNLRLRWPTATPSWAVWERAELLLRSYSLSFWDALIVAACLEAGVTRLYSEDFGYATIDGLEIVNPFV